MQGVYGELKGDVQYFTISCGSCYPRYKYPIAFWEVEKFDPDL